jgi:5-methyltetrahydrofolate--homocysteine methyltransferase
MMKSILERLADGEILFCDGAMGTFLQAKGLEPGECPELWCVDRPADVSDVHQRYREAGSDIVECNSFGGTRYKLSHYGLEDRTAEINRASAALALDVAAGTQHVLGSVGPTGAFLQPYGMETEEAFYEAFKTQVVALEAGGADAVIIETMTAIEEATAAIKAAKENTGLTVVASFTFDPQVDGGFATMMGLRPRQAAEAAIEVGADIISANCGTGPDHMLSVIKQYHEAVPNALLMAMPNAGMPEIENGETVFRETPAQMAEKAPGLVEAGARIIGGCCGTGPEHIAAMRGAVLGAG